MLEYQVEIEEKCKFSINTTADSGDEAIENVIERLDDRNRVIRDDELIDCDYSNWKAKLL